MSSEALHSFAKEIGWKENILVTFPCLTDEWNERLKELFEIYGRPASWSSDAIGTVEYKENGEHWVAQYRTFIDGKKIWRLYERVDHHPERPKFRIARRSPELVWEHMGYFNKWPQYWHSNDGIMGVLREKVKRVKSWTKT